MLFEGSGCRHCPFDEDEGLGEGSTGGEAPAAVLMEKTIVRTVNRKSIVVPRTPTYLHHRKEKVSVSGKDIVFFSSGKDSLLSLRKWIRSLFQSLYGALTTPLSGCKHVRENRSRQCFHVLHCSLLSTPGQK